MNSDHCPLRITWNHCQQESEERKEKIFRFEKIWLENELFSSCIQQSWGLGRSCADKIKATKEALILLEKESGSHMKDLKRLERKLQDAEGCDPTQENIQKKKALLKEYNQVLKEDEIYWLQRSRALWLKEGDKNTNFFPL
ncbi:hypothetical protein SESBI_36561 [Sesbania bispinosa]|nr:hypothetical protein SESBI_36561 [Sesbania bispinosa]